MFLRRIVTNTSIIRNFAKKCKGDKWGKGAACKACIVTGGSAGIGFSMAKCLLAAGAKGVIIADFNEEKGKKAACELNEEFAEDKAKAFFKLCDVTNKDHFECLFEFAIKKYKYVDIVVNNAGILQFKHWEREIATNVYGVALGSLLGFKYMGRNNGGNGGAIINCASILGLQPFHGCPVYDGSKHFIIGFTRSMGHEYYENLTGVKINAVCPGVTDTQMITDSHKYSLEGFGDVGKILKDGLLALPSQPAHTVGTCIIDILDSGENGTAWVIEDSECYKVKFPDRHTMRECD